MNFICENNDLQGANIVYGSDGGKNTLREFNTDVRVPSATEIEISYNKKTSTLAVSSEGDVECFAIGENATVKNGVVNGNGTITVFAAKTDGSGVCAKTTITLTPTEEPNTVAIACIIVAAIIVVAMVIIIAIILIKHHKKQHQF